MYMDSIKRRFQQIHNQERIGYLIAGFITHTLTIEEEEELDTWIIADEKNMQLFEDMTEEKQVAEFLQWLSTRDTEARLEAVKKTNRGRKEWQSSFLMAICSSGMHYINGWMGIVYIVL